VTRNDNLKLEFQILIRWFPHWGIIFFTSVTPRCVDKDVKITFRDLWKGVEREEEEKESQGNESKGQGEEGARG
jgi:hypothetical protein